MTKYQNNSQDSIAEVSKRFSQIVQNIMDDNNLSQFSLARTLGVSQSQISNWLNEKFSPSLSSVVKLCNHFDIDPVELFKQKKSQVDSFKKS